MISEEEFAGLFKEHNPVLHDALHTKRPVYHRYRFQRASELYRSAPLWDDKLDDALREYAAAVVFSKSLYSTASPEELNRYSYYSLFFTPLSTTEDLTHFRHFRGLGKLDQGLQGELYGADSIDDLLPLGVKFHYEWVHSILRKVVYGDSRSGPPSVAGLHRLLKLTRELPETPVDFLLPLADLYL